MQKMHSQINLSILGNSIYLIVDKSVHAELLLLESTVALMNFIMCNPSLTLGRILINSILFSLFCITSAASEYIYAKASRYPSG